MEGEEEERRKGEGGGCDEGGYVECLSVWLELRHLRLLVNKYLVVLERNAEVTVWMMGTIFCLLVLKTSNRVLDGLVCLCVRTGQ